MIEGKARTKVANISTVLAGNAAAVASDRNTPTILGAQENPHKVELTVGEDGVTTVGNYKLGKYGW